MSGICYGVSVGPGAAHQITLEAVEIIKTTDVVFLPSFPKEDCKAYQIVKKSLPAIDHKDLRCQTFTMSRDSKVMADRHEEIFQSVKSLLDQGKNIAFLTLGEVGLYSTYLYIHEKLVRENYSSVLINGVSSVQAVAARLGISLALGREEVHIFPDTDNLKERLALSGTKVFMKPKGDFKEIIDQFKLYNCQSAKNNNRFQIMGVSNCGMDNERVARSIEELENLEGYFTVFMVKEAEN